MAPNPGADESAHDGDEQTTEQTETVKVELAEADIERIEYEIANGHHNEHSPETVGEWLERTMWMEFARIDDEAVYHSEVEVEVPDAALKRAQLAVRSRQQRGKSSDMSTFAEVEDRLLNDVATDYRWFNTDGERVDLKALNEDGDTTKSDAGEGDGQ